MIFDKKTPDGRVKAKGPRTQLITGVHMGHTTWRLLRWLLFLAALLSVVCGGFLLSLRSSEMKSHCISLNVDGEQTKSIATDVAGAFRKYWFVFVIALAGMFTFFELFIHSRLKIYIIYALISIAAWTFVLYSLNLMPGSIEEIRKAIEGG